MPVVLEVQQHVGDRVSHFPGSLQFSRVIAISPDFAVTPKRFVNRFGDPDRKTLHPTRYTQLINRFDDQMDVISLNREVQNSEIAALSEPNCVPNREVCLVIPQRR
jgi:hypothetical protein